METNIRLKEKDLQQMNGDVVKEHARVHYHSVQIIPSLFDLLHVPSLHASKQIIDEAVQGMKKHAREETTTIPKIYTEELVGTCIANPGMVTGFSCPDLRSIDSALHRQRALNFPRLSTDLLNFKVPYEWTLGLYAEPFLLIDEFCKSIFRIGFISILQF